MRDSNSLLPTSSVEMKTDGFSSYANYAKAGLIFATTTATYFLAKAIGVLPSWFWGSESSSGSERMDTALTELDSSSLVIGELSPEVAIFSKQEELAKELGGFTSGVVESSLTDFQEIDLPSPLLTESVGQDQTDQFHDVVSDHYLPAETELEDEIVVDTTLIKSTRRRLLQQTSTVTVMNPIPNQRIDVNQLYEYSLNEVFTGEYTFLGVLQADGSPLPDWLNSNSIIGNYNYPKNTESTVDVVILGDTVFMASNYELRIIDVSIPSTPRLLGSYDTPGVAIAVSGSTVFMASGGTGLLVVDVSNSSEPRLLGSYDTPGSASDVVVSGSTVFVADADYALGVNGGLQIIDVGNLSAPRLLGSTNTPGSANKIAILGNTVFVTAYYNNAPFIAGVWIIDVSTPSAPRLLNSYLGPYFSVAVSGNMLFLGDSTGLEIADVSTPSAPHFLGTYYAGTSVEGITVLGSTVFMTEHGLQIVGVSNGRAPRLLGSYYTPGFLGTNVVVSGSMVFVADGEAGLQIMDPHQLKLTGIPPMSSLGQQIALTVYATNATHRLTNTSFILTVDQLPYILQTSISDQSVFPDDRLSLRLSSSRLFVNPGYSFLSLSVQSQNGEKPSWLTVSLSSPIKVAGYNFYSRLQKVAVLGSTVFVASGEAGLQVVDVSTWNSPRLLSSYSYASNGGGGISSVAVSGSTVFLTMADGILQILDVSNSSVPRLLSSYDPPGDGVSDIVVSGSTLFMAAYVAGLQIVDVSNSSVPYLLSSYAPLNAEAVAISGSTVVVADNNNNELLILDVSQWTLTAAPTLTDVNNYNLGLVATDALGATISANFTLRVEGPPRINGTIGQQHAKVGQAFNYFLPQGLITDPNFDTIDFSARVQGNLSFPKWLSFNDVSAIFVGVPQEEDIGNFTVILSATDHIPGTATLETTFGLLVDHLPVVTQNIPAQVAGIGLRYGYTVPDTTFFEPDGYPMSYSAQQSNRLPLPVWLTFNTISRQFEGQPNSTDTGTYSIAVIVNDDYQGQAKTDFVLVVENFPTVNQSLTALLAGVGIPFNWEIPLNTFLDVDNDPLTYTAHQQDGSLLPNWLSFNPRSLVFSGVPQSTDVRVLPMQLSAQDPSGGRAQQNFNLTVAYFPEAKGTIPTQLADVDEFYQYTVAANTFSQADNAVLLYSAQQSSGLDLPDWLRFNTTTRQLSGYPNVTMKGRYELGMIVTNPVGAQAWTNFSLIVEHLPKVQQSIMPPLVDVGAFFNWVMPSNAFVDQDGDLLTYTARQQDGSLLPNWLSFNSRTQIFSGIPQSTDEGLLPLTVDVADDSGGQAQQSFNLTITPFPKLAQPIPLQLINVNASYLYTMPLETFTGANQSVLIYSAQQSSGLKLPDWLRFNETTRRLSGQPNATVIGRYELAIIATNPVGAQASANFSLIAEYFPEVLQSILPPLADINSAFSFIVFDNSFIDRDGDTLTYTAQHKYGGALPNWLTFNPQSLRFSGVPLETDKGDLPLQIIATDPAGASVTNNLTIQVIHFPVLAHPASTITFRAGQFFNFSLPPDTFTDQDQVGLSYSIPSPLPDWLAFNNQTLSFSGTPASGNIGTVSLILMATDMRGASTDMSFQIVARANVPPVVLEAALSNQAATVGQVFSYFLPVPLFVDSYNNTLTYSATQQDNSPLPGWLSFDNQSLHFSGTPGHGDTNFYATRTVGVKVSAQSDEGQAGINVNIIVDGISWGQLAVNIGAPLFSVLTTVLAAYEYRALLLNRLNQKKYAKLKDEMPPDVIRVGERFERQLHIADAKKIKRFYTSIPNESAEGCCQFFKADTRPLPGGKRLPRWMEYDEDRHCLHSIDKVPEGIQYNELVIQVEGEASVILEKFTLKIEPQSQPLEVKVKKEKKDESKDENTEVEMTELTSGGSDRQMQSPTIALITKSTKIPSLTDLQESKKDSPLSLNQRKIVPASTPTTLGTDSPLLKGRKPTSSVMEGDSRKKQTGKETGDDQIVRQSRSCC